jgi:sugar lactone lactonase YvrE
MGVVLRAFDDKLHRIVAIKVMSSELAATSPPRKRFLREARAAAAIRHECVVDIHAVEEQPIPYLVMEYVAGETLQQKLDRIGPLETPEVLRLGQQIARGLTAAHEKGLIHRDIKPSNILLEMGAEERVKITDFGLARAVADASLRQSGVIAGTPMYMAPEQIVGDSIDHRADLFSFGSVLYTMASGRPPFRATTSMATLKRVAEDAPRPIRDIIPEVPEWLCDIIAKLHAKKPDDRFQSAKEVGDLLGQYKAHVEHPALVPMPARTKPIEVARPESSKGLGESTPVKNATRFEDLGRATRKRRWIVGAALLSCLVVGFSLLEATGVTHLRATLIGVFTPDGPDVNTTKGGGKPGNGGEAGGGKAGNGGKATPLDFKVGEVRKHNWAGRHAYFAGFSPDGRYYVATGDRQGSGPETVRVWELASGKLVLEVKGNEFALFTPDSKRLIAAGPADNQIHVWDLAARQQIAQFGEHPDAVRLSSLSADGKQLLTGCNDDIVRLWDVAAGKEIARLESDDKLGYPYFCPDGKQAITLDWPTNIIRLWDLAQRKEIRRWQQPDTVTARLAFLPGGQRFVSAGPDAVYFWDMAAEKETQSLQLVGKVKGIAFSPDGSRLLYAVANDPVLRLVELPGGKELATFEMSQESVDDSFGIAFSPDGRFAVAAYWAGVVQLWRLPDPAALGKK